MSFNIMQAPCTVHFKEPDGTVIRNEVIVKDKGLIGLRTKTVYRSFDYWLFGAGLIVGYLLTKLM